MVNFFIISQIILPLIVATMLFLGINKYAAYFVTTVTSGLLTIISTVMLCYSLSGEYRYYFGGWLPPLGIELLITPLNSIMLCLISFSACFTFLLGYKSFINKTQTNHASFCSLLMITLTGMYGIVLTNDFFNLYVFIEISSIALYALTSVGTKDATKAAFNYLIIGTIGAILILLGIGFLYSASGTLNMDHFLTLLPSLKNTKTISIGCYLIIVGLLLKSALFPLHSWLVDLYNTTNQIILPFISSVSTKIYIFILIKMVTITLPIKSLIIEKISFIAVIGIIITSIAATQQKTIRSVLAYSTLANICYLMLTLNTNNSLIIALVLIVSHSLVKLSLFILTNHIIQSKKTDKISSLQNLFFEMPTIVILFVINAASLVGVPLTLGFISKCYLLTGLIYNESWFIVLPVLITSFISLIYAWRIIEVTFCERDENKPQYINQTIYVQKNNMIKYGILTLTAINLIIGTYFISIPFNWQFN